MFSAHQHSVFFKISFCQAEYGEQTRTEVEETQLFFVFFRYGESKLLLEKLNKTGLNHKPRFTFTFMHLADAFIQSDLQCIQVIHVLSECVFPGNQTHNLCAANAML